MAEAPFYSSQESHYERRQMLDNLENVASSPLPAHSIQKPKRLPTVTPKRFNKFFTPRDAIVFSTRNGRQSKAGRQLRDITKNGANYRRSIRPLPSSELVGINENELSGRPLKRRKHSIDIASSPPQSSPLKHVQAAHEIKIFEDVPTSPAVFDEDDLLDAFDRMEPFPKPIRRLRQTDRGRKILQRSFGGFDALTRGWSGNEHCADWRAETANYVATPQDIHPFTGSALPFCTASCNTNSLIAIGEEEGNVRLIDSSPASDFAKPHIAFKPHSNAIMDIAFSPDDYMLATASGDQTARVIDMQTQRTVCILSGHTSSVKQVRFRPNDDNMITTSSRDGSVQIWDMRCGGRGSIASLRNWYAKNVDNGAIEPTVQYARDTLRIGSAHRSTTTANTTPAGTSSDLSGVSITSIEHMPNGREHLLLTTSEHNSSIKLWDLRNAGRRGLAAPVSSIPVPSNHNRTRHYGINSMVWSTDGARLYTACRDSTVYAYSTNHFLLGHAPELTSTSRSRSGKATKAGVGPLYAFRHPDFRLGTFYIKAALRPARGDKSEMLAVGSSNDCAVLFSTDERHLPSRERPSATEEDEQEDGEADLPSLPPPSSHSKKANEQANGIPIYNHGTALVRGHNKEVTSLTWTHDGELVTIGDDFSARCWREHGGKARELRACGESGGQRWGCGWADITSGWDEDDC